MYDSMEERVRRVELYLEAQRIIGLFAYYMADEEFEKIPDLFALDMPTLRAEMLWGVYSGSEGIKRLFEGYFPNVCAQKAPQAEQLQAMEVPIIKVAKDCQTVKGVWVCPGYITTVNDGGEKKAYWSWQKCACDFIVTKNGLKMWHFHVYGLFESLYGTTEVLPSGTVRFNEDIPDQFAPDIPPTTKFDLSKDSIYPYEPAVPADYTVFDFDYAF